MLTSYTVHKCAEIHSSKINSLFFLNCIVELNYFSFIIGHLLCYFTIKETPYYVWQATSGALGQCSSFSGCGGMKYVDALHLAPGWEVVCTRWLAHKCKHTLCTCRVHMHYGDLHSAFQTKLMWPCALNWQFIMGRAQPNMRPSQIKSLKWIYHNRDVELLTGRRVRQ